MKAHVKVRVSVDIEGGEEEKYALVALVSGATDGEFADDATAFLRSLQNEFEIALINHGVTPNGDSPGG